MSRFLPSMLCAAVLLSVFALTGPAQAQQKPGDDWYVFRPTDTPAPGEIGMQAWLHRPAGKFGRPVMDGDQLLIDGEPVKLWGLNNSYMACAPEKSLAEQRAAFYAKFGFNTVRLHKYANGPGWRGITREDSFVHFVPDKLDRMDYYVAQLKKHGQYVKLSPSFGVRLGPDERKYHPAYYDELSEGGKKAFPRVPYGGAYFFPEIQQVAIDQMLNILGHENPYTEMKYVDDPAIACIEIINEDSVLWYGTSRVLQGSEVVRKQAGKLFSDWLRDKYGSHEKLVEAWGEKALDAFASESEHFTGEHLDKNNIVPFGNPWYYSPGTLENPEHQYLRPRMFDTMRFLYELQNDFYDRFVNQVAEAGWEGPIVASNWQAGDNFSHYYNLHSDARIGVIDRHNYFGGGRKGNNNNASMLANAGSGLLSTGMQQVADRPFMFSEWIHVWPSQWGAEGPAILGAYGMGLQGWDVSYMFENGDDGGYTDRLGDQSWEVTSPQILGVMPAVSRQVLRGDVRESSVVAPRYVHVPSLIEGKLDFRDQLEQQFDVKSLDSDKVPAEALAVARCVIDFTDEYKKTPEFDLSSYQSGQTLTSATDQLRWTQADGSVGGFFAMDTPATKGVVGFSGGERSSLSGVTIEPESRFSAVYVTAREPEGTIADSDKLLIVAVARARNTGQTYNEDYTKLLEKGRSPIVMEPVKARITLDRPGTAVLTLLDHDGQRTGEKRVIRDGVIEIDGAQDKTPYYLLDYTN
ncbi:MAG: hypothetical protein ACLFVN_12095 [Phycisphaeraceae bacterium]